MADQLQPDNWNTKGLAVAVTIIGTWALLLVFLLTGATVWAWWTPLAIAAQTFLYTGLFITAHDAMHGTVSPDFPRLNRFVGALSVGLYALFSFRRLQTSHWEHHRHPASEEDPDFHRAGRPGVLAWYMRFMGRYLSPLQILGMALIFNVLLYGAGVSAAHLIVFWVAPALLSTWQLFYFGTVLPHRPTDDGYADEHRATSTDLAPLLSFLSCYHFGYHWEHHERPDLPWWALPRFRRQRLNTARNG